MLHTPLRKQFQILNFEKILIYKNNIRGRAGELSRINYLLY